MTTFSCPPPFFPALKEAITFKKHRADLLDAPFPRELGRIPEARFL